MKIWTCAYLCRQCLTLMASVKSVKEAVYAERRSQRVFPNLRDVIRERSISVCEYSIPADTLAAARFR